jgi:hypothetical protein
MKGHLTLLLLLTIFTRPAFCAIDITLLSAPEGAISPGTHHTLEAQIQSSTAINSVSAELGTLQFDLERTSGSEENGYFISTWRQVFTVPEIPDGPTNLITSIHASNEETAITNRSIIIASPPTLVIEQLFDGYTLHSGKRLPIKVTAFDEDSEAYIDVFTPEYQFTRTNHIDLQRIIPYSAWIGFRARGNHLQMTNKSILVYVQQNPKFVPIADVPGFIRDADATRILYQRDNALTIYQIGGQSNGPVLFQSISPWVITNALLTPYGALVTERRGLENNYRILDVREDNEITDIGPVTSLNTLQVRGNFVLWTGASNDLIRRDLLSRVNVEITNTFAAGPNRSSLAANGDVSFTDTVSRTIFRYRSGQLQQISTNTPGSAWPGNTRQENWTDGTNILYARQGDGGQLDTFQRYFLYTPEQTVPLGATHSWKPGSLADGWAAFYNLGTLFVRSPSGALAERPIGGLWAITSQGDSLHQRAIDNTFHVFKPDFSVINAGNFEGRFIERNGHWEGILGSTLFSIRENFTNLMVLHHETGVLSLNFIGTANNTYQIQITGKLNPPITWTPLRAPMKADTNGSIGFLEPIPPTNRFYRAVQTQP